MCIRDSLRTDPAYLIEMVHHGYEVEAGLFGGLGVLGHAVEQAVVGNPGKREGGM